jgi:hypothetical protein
MKTRWRVVLVIAVAAAATLAANYARDSYAKRNREAAYQSILLSYRGALKTGTTRKAVESYLHERGATFERVCCTKGQAMDDRSLIGKEDPPWYCSRNDVYLSFQFEAPEDTVGDADILRSIEVSHQLGPCL